MKKSLFLIASAILAMAACVPGSEEKKDILLPPAVYGTDMFVDVTEYDATFRYTGSAPKVLWKINTGETLDTPTATYTFDTPATYSVKLGIADETTTDWSWSEAHSFTMTAPPKSKKPVIDKDMLISSEATTTEFTLNMSYTGDLATMWKWVFEDETVIETKEASRIYTAEGDHNVKLGICDGAGKEWLWSDVYEFSAVLAAAVPTDLTPGTKLYIGGEGVADIDKDHHMTYMPSIDYHPDRNIAPVFSDFCGYKNDAGNNPQAEYFNTWSIYDTGENVWTKYFDYEIFVKLLGGKDIWFYNTDVASNPVYVGFEDTYTWKDQPATQGKTTAVYTKSAVPFQVPQDGYYRIRFRSDTKEAYILRILDGGNAFFFRHWPGPQDVNLTDLNSGGGEYLGHGAWSKVLDFSGYQYNPAVGAQGAFGYKFLFDGFDSQQPYGKQYPDAEYEAFNPENVGKFWKIVPVQGGPWGGTGANGTWTLPDEFYKKTVKISAYFNDTYGAYVYNMVLQ